MRRWREGLLLLLLLLSQTLGTADGSATQGELRILPLWGTNVNGYRTEGREDSTPQNRSPNNHSILF
eukprot:jgi/Psemu1/316956/fgenesh1_kg.4835_\